MTSAVAYHNHHILGQLLIYSNQQSKSCDTNYKNLQIEYKFTSTTVTSTNQFISMYALQNVTWSASHKCSTSCYCFAVALTSSQTTHTTVCTYRYTFRDLAAFVSLRAEKKEIKNKMSLTKTTAVRLKPKNQTTLRVL